MVPNKSGIKTFGWNFLFVMKRIEGRSYLVNVLSRWEIDLTNGLPCLDVWLAFVAKL